MEFEPLSDELERIGKEIVDSAYRVHRELGPGVLESVYEECMLYDLRRKGLEVSEQVHLPIMFDGHLLKKNRLRIDMVVEGQVVVENKAVAEIIPLYEAQTLPTSGREKCGWGI